MQSYALTTAAALERLGHPVTLFGEQLGETAELARERGLRVVAEGELASTYDAVLAQDALTALRLAGRYAAVPRVVVAHGADLDIHRPPLLSGAVDAVICLNDRVARRLEALPGPARTVRLTQPIDLTWFRPAGPLRPRPERVLLLGNHLSGVRRDVITSVCEARGLKWTHAGAHGHRVTDVRPAIGDADLVVGYGRSILEAMALGRAVYVYDVASGDGWVTGETYRALEADGFGGLATERPIDAERFARDLDDYHPTMGASNVQVIRQRHAALDHAEELVSVLAELSPSPPPPLDTIAEVSRLVRSEYASRAQARAARTHMEDLRGRLHEAERLATEAEASADARVAALLGTRRWRLASRLAVPLERMRQRSRT